ncbi:ABC transporter substrate-binding protein [Acidovorax sp. SUPP2825]|uniref:ABC transporter substrate-binding protein n=1 Tax=Acidovorax sp. SUPP2825 TaxID=2920879 RepID=UPI0023DE2090|nr:ABC transporter substrate-binding protein [Acidovorax sp. SUPP2825]GKS94013.1 ABC transporter substrate-binding protein [Acidovorax sp. SUPP2825]
MTFSPPSPARLGRRGFLGASVSTAATVACAAAPALAAPTDQQPLARHGIRRTVGVLLPESSRYPTLSAEFLAGLQVGAEASEHPPRWLPLPYGRSPQAALRQARDAVGSGAVDALAGWLPMQSARDLVPLLEANQVPFLASDTGADRLPTRLAARSPWLIAHTLGLWQSCAVLGQEAPRRWGSRALLCMGFLESGYDFPHEFRRAFEAAGGTVSAVHVSGLPDGSDEFAGLRSAWHSARADFVVALYSGAQALRFQRQWSQLQPHSPPPVVGTLFSQGPADAVQALPRGWASVASWNAGSDACRSIAARCTPRGAGSLTDLSGPALLGFEAGQRFAQWQSNGAGVEQLALLRAAPDNGPRGAQPHDLASGERNGTHWLRGGTPATGVATELAWATRGTPAPLGAPGCSGWATPYLVT